MSSIASYTRSDSNRPQLGTASDLTRRDWLIACAIFVLALAARLVFLFNSPDRDWPHSVFYEGDAVLWVEWAQAIDRGSVFEFDLPIHPPAVAYAIAYLYDGVHVTGFLGMKALWCAMSAAACGLTYLACAGAMNHRIALIAALLLTFSFNQYVLATSLNGETPYLMLLPAMVALTRHVGRAPTLWSVAALGLTHGAGMLLRPEHPLLMLLLVLWMLFHRSSARPTSKPMAARPQRSVRVLATATVILIALVTCLPWTIHAVNATRRFNNLELIPVNFGLAPVTWDASAQAALSDLPAFARHDNFSAVNFFAQQRSEAWRDVPLSASDIHAIFMERFGWIPRPLSRFVLISNQAAFSFALANHPDANGGFSRAALAHPLRGDDPTFAFAFPPHNQIFVDGWRVGWNFIRDDPGTWLGNVGRKFERFIEGITSGFGAANLPLGRTGVREPVDIVVTDSSLARPWRVVILSLIVAGVACGIARRLPISPWVVIIIYKLLITLAFYGYARQGASIAPAFFVFIAIANDTLLIPLDRRRPGLMRRHAIIAACTSIALLAGDVLFARRQHEQIAGTSVPRPDLGSGAFQAFTRIEIR